MDEIEEEIKISQGFDRNIDYDVMKDKLNKRIIEIYTQIKIKRKPILLNKLTYIVIAAIQLRNGSRISEAVKAFMMFMKHGINKRVTVKISKSGGIKIKRDGTKIQTKTRFREMMWPNNWISDEIYELLKKSKTVKTLMTNGRLKKRILDHLLTNFECNTHSLRYAFINYALYVLKRPMSDVAKYVGHANVSQMVTYTQKKNADQMFDLDI